MTIRVGADPELFLVDVSGKFISSIGLIGGSKQNPRKIREDGCAVQEDNVAVEFNIPPSHEVDHFIESINFNLEYLTRLVREKGLSLSVVASAEFSLDQLSHPKAMEFGCDPDWNAWTMQINPRPRTKNKQLRSSGGHVHVETDDPPFLMARCLDLFLGVPSVNLDPDINRRQLYGKAGACRPKEYGVEYRTLSNFWLQSDELKSWVFHQVQRADEFLRTRIKEVNYLESEKIRIQQCINTSNKELAKEIIEQYAV